MADLVAAEIADQLLPWLVDAARPPDLETVRAALAANRLVVPARLLDPIVDELRGRLLGYGELEPLIRTGVSDVLVNSPTSVWLDEGAGLLPAAIRFESVAAIRRLATRLAAFAGRRLDDSQPFVDALLPDGIRLQAALPPIAVGSPVISLRLPLSVPLPIDHWRAQLQGRVARELFARVVAGEFSCVISGATGSGKTTLLRSLLTSLPTARRIVCVEDVQELNLLRPNIVALQGRSANAEGFGRVELAELVRHTLRMRPDCIVVGEVRGPEVLDWLLAVSSGHKGSATTVHADSPAHALRRLGLLAQISGLPAAVARGVISDAVDVVIQCAQLGTERRIVEIKRVADLVAVDG